MTNALAKAFRFHMQRGMNATKAIAAARADALAGKARYPGPVKPYAACSWDRDKRGLAYVTDEGANGLRSVGAVHDLSDTPIGHKGWYTDEYYHDTCYGVVYQLPARDGTPRYVAGYEFSNVDGGPTLDMSETYAEVRDAAYAADSMAEHAAETERDYQRAWSAGSRYSDAGEELAAERSELLAILAERRKARVTAGYPALCKALRRQVATMLDSIAELKAERAELRNGDREGLWFRWDATHKGAFNEGAGETVIPV